MSADTFICKIPRQGRKIICADRWRMRYTRGVRLKEGKSEQIAELQLDTTTLQMGMLETDIIRFQDEKERLDHNILLIRRIDERWEILGTSEADERKKPLIKYKEWISIEGK